MRAITYLVGDATAPKVGPGRRAIIAHCCNDIGAWGAGFVLAISRRWPHVKRAYCAAFQEGVARPMLGDVQLVEATPQIWVANIIGQRGCGLDPQGNPPIRLDALRVGMAKVCGDALRLHASVHMPRIGCGLAGGKWDEVEPIIIDELSAKGIEVFVYDFTP